VYVKKANPEVYPLEINEVEKLHDVVKNSELVLMAVYSGYGQRTVQITNFIRQNYPDLKIIWGGPHCIAAPEISLEYADGVCFSEGDQIVVDLVNRIESGQDFSSLPNMAFKLDGTIVKNEILPPFTDLDSLPYPDFDMKDILMLDGDLYQLTKENAHEWFATFPFGRPTYNIMTSRGCPHICSYCNNCLYVSMWGKNSIRFFSVDHVIGELEHSLNSLDFITAVAFDDDDFFFRPKDQLKDFAEKYKKTVNLPFGTSFSANTFREDKLEILIDAGLKSIQMGVQSGSQRVLDEVFNRKVPVQKTKDVTRKIERYQKKFDLMLGLDIILDNPYENDNDIIESYRYFIDLPLDSRINIYTLSFFPGSPLYDRALKDGIIKSFSMEASRLYKSEIQYQKNYPTFLLFLIMKLYLHGLTKRIPKFIFSALASFPVRKIASIFPRSMYAYLIKKVRKRLFIPRYSCH
jgi:radical SAM superfamily enzyme YgiQ (UPF0313 family)